MKEKPLITVYSDDGVELLSMNKSTSTVVLDDGEKTTLENLINCYRKSEYREAKTHELKCLPEYYAAVVKGEKTFEIRKHDRDFKVGDKLWLREYNVEKQSYTNFECFALVTYILHHGEAPMWIPEGFCIMSIVLK